MISFDSAMAVSRWCLECALGEGMARVKRPRIYMGLCCYAACARVFI